MEYSEKYINEFVRDLDPFSILVIFERKLYRLKCPFKVLALVDLAGLRAGDEKCVSKVMVTRDLMMVYIIQDVGYHFYLFQILPFNI